jgi:hypothetical protein
MCPVGKDPVIYSLSSTEIHIFVAFDRGTEFYSSEENNLWILVRNRKTVTLFGIFGKTLPVGMKMYLLRELQL